MSIYVLSRLLRSSDYRGPRLYSIAKDRGESYAF